MSCILEINFKNFLKKKSEVWRGEGEVSPDCHAVWLLLVTGLTSLSGEPRFASLATRATDVPDQVVPPSPQSQNERHLTLKLVPPVG